MFVGCGFTAIFLRGDEEESKGMKTSEGKHEDVGKGREGGSPPAMLLSVATGSRAPSRKL
jgi:hypothetical protein